MAYTYNCFFKIKEKGLKINHAEILRKVIM